MPSRYKERYKVMRVIKTIFRFRFNLYLIWRNTDMSLEIGMQRSVLETNLSRYVLRIE